MADFKVAHLKSKNPQAIDSAAGCSGQGHTRRGSCCVYLRPWHCGASGLSQEVNWKSITIWFVLASLTFSAITDDSYDLCNEVRTLKKTIVFRSICMCWYVNNCCPLMRAYPQMFLLWNIYLTCCYILNLNIYISCAKWSLLTKPHSTWANCPSVF